MSKVDPNVLVDWSDGQKFLSDDYEAERTAIVLAVDDNGDRIVLLETANTDKGVTLTDHENRLVVLEAYKVTNDGRVQALEDDLAANYYTKINLITSGQASVHWDNLTNVPNFGDQSWKPAVATYGMLPVTGNSEGDMRVVLDDGDGKQAVYLCEATTGTTEDQWEKVGDVDWQTEEATRVSNETARVIQEDARVVAENARVSAESIRVSQEDTRESNEATRIANEAARAVFYDEHKIETYTDLAQIGLTDGDLTNGDEYATFDTIIKAMPSNSFLIVYGGNGDNLASCLPGNFYHLEIHKGIDNDYNTLKCSQGANEVTYFATYSDVNNSFSGWKAFVGSSDNSINCILERTQAEYDALTPDANTLYIIVG